MAGMTSTARTRAYRKGEVVAEDFPVADVSDHLAHDDTIVWVDLCGPSIDQLHELAGELGLHELAVEDALEPHQRPKLDHYASHLFLSTHAVEVDGTAGELHTDEIDAFIGDRWLITVRQDDSFPVQHVLERWDRSSDLAVYGVSFLLYGLLDVIVDGYFDAVEVFDGFYDDVSEEIFSEHPLRPEQQKHWFEMRRALTHFHRLALPMREAVSGLMRREHSAVCPELYPYFQDVYDHVLRVTESTDSLRDLISSIVETNLSLRDYRQNQVMKKVTSWAAIIAVPTLVTGYYGMNVRYPGFATRWAAPFSTALMVVVSVGLYVLFKKKEWL
jgi:magnesium transporter